MKKPLMVDYVKSRITEIEQYCSDNGLSFEAIWHTCKSYNHEVICFLSDGHPEEGVLGMYYDEPMTPVLTITRDGENLLYQLCKNVPVKYKAASYHEVPEDDRKDRSPIDWKKLLEEDRKRRMQPLLLLVTYTLLRGGREQFIDEIIASGALDAVCNEDGCIEYAYYLDESNNDQIVLVERWQSQDQFRQHLYQPSWKRIKAIKDRYVLDTQVRMVRPDMRSGYLSGSNNESNNHT